MDLLLTREYWPGGTNGRLYWGEEFFCFTIESPAIHFRPATACIPEGRYELQLDDKSGQPALLSLSPCGKTISPLRQKAEMGTEMGMHQIVLVAAITDEGRGIPDPTALTLLKTRIGQLLGKGKGALLEIRSYPEQALNLTYHQIAWMD